MPTLEQLKNLEVPEGFQKRIEYFIKRGNSLVRNSSEKVHAINCFKKGFKVYEEGSMKYPEFDFIAPINPMGIRLLLDDAKNEETIKLFFANDKKGELERKEGHNNCY
ncbi:MAG: hypothetical protein CVU43_16475 [Chloroflexi bacterium HGW-Chloroflexi-5]|jgi:hypothetical protein|nr:MAG: hypothetical protein CVU43_16475 [Chloroflexi bacterium HGW-Chloroflexi-5]